VVIALMTFAIGLLFIRETKDRRIADSLREDAKGGGPLRRAFFF
jgi:hypothetical protein